MGGGGLDTFKNYEVIYKQPLVAVRSRKMKIIPSSLKNVATKTTMPADGQEKIVMTKAMMLMSSKAGLRPSLCDDRGEDKDNNDQEEDSYKDNSIQ